MRQGARLLVEPSGRSSSLAVVALWLVTAPYFALLNTWQLNINTQKRLIVTFLVVFLIQNAQNRVPRAIHAHARGPISTRGGRPAKCSTLPAVTTSNAPASSRNPLCRVAQNAQ
jgi:hypothetical protein